MSGDRRYMPQENVYGLPINVYRKAQHPGGVDGVSTIIVMRCVDMPPSTIPEPIRSRNKRTPCDRCRELCWLDPVHSVPGMRIVCLACTSGKLEIYASSEQLAEVRRLIGGYNPEGGTG